jgi:hypothetical protein
LAPDQPFEPPIPVLAAPAKARPRPARTSKFESWQLLNPYSARHFTQLSLGIVGYRPVNEERESVGYSLAIGEGLSTVRTLFLAGGLQEHELRFVPKDSLSLRFSRYMWEAGPRLGPLEPMVRVGFTSIHLDIGHGVSFGMFSPRVGAGLWLKLPNSRVGVSVFTEYSWRWVGDDSAFVHGLTFEIQPMAKPLLKRPTRFGSSVPASR